MSRSLIIKLLILWTYLITAIIVGNTYFSNFWRSACEVLQIIHMSIVIYLSIILYKKLSRIDKKLFKWFLISNVCLILSTIFYFIVDYILHIVNVNQSIALTYLIPSFLWITLSLVFWGNLAYHKVKLKNNFLVIIAILLTNICLGYIISRLDLKPVTGTSDQFLFLQIYSNIVTFLIFNLSICVLICANKIGTRLLATGAISIIGANFLTSYIAYTYDPSSVIYRNDYWLFSSSIYISGLLFLLSSKQVQLGGFSKEYSIKNIITGWTLSIIVVTATLSLGLADYFNSLSSHLLSVLPYLMFIYIILGVFTSLLISYFFEEPIRILNNTIHNFLEQPKEQFKSRIAVDELAELNNFLQYTIKLTDERNNLHEFRKIADQMAHDIGSPLMTLSILTNNCPELSESKRNMIRESASRIRDIASSLLCQYSKAIPVKDNHIDEMLVHTVSEQIILDKQCEYQHLEVKFNYEYNKDDVFSFIRVNIPAFKRMLSNLINNAVDSFEGNPGTITLALECIANKMVIKIKDDGKGMPESVCEKILNNIAVTDGKQDGHGIGYAQIRETLQNNSGKLDIMSKVGDGTIITLTFPRVPLPSWTINSVKLNHDDIIVILDDDSSVHGAWDLRFEQLLKENNKLYIKHFTSGEEAIAYINSLDNTTKSKVLLLTDFELLEQELDGLEVIEKTQVKRSLLVTSHYSGVHIRERAIATNTKILPKSLACEISIYVKTKCETNNNNTKVELVIVDDDTDFLTTLTKYVFGDRSIDIYETPSGLLENINKYSKNTKMILDNQFGENHITGLVLARKLHILGYTRLYLLSGKLFKAEEFPEYLIPVLKGDLDQMQSVIFS